MVLLNLEGSFNDILLPYVKVLRAGEEGLAEHQEPLNVSSIAHWTI